MRDVRKHVPFRYRHGAIQSTQRRRRDALQDGVRLGWWSLYM